MPNHRAIWIVVAIAGRAGVMAKIEKPKALASLPEILELADALMVARGDLGVELPAEAVPGKRTPADNATVRTVFLVGPDKKIKLMLFYPMTTGRNFDEVVRALDSIQLTAKHKVATPANWRQGQDVIIAGSVSDDEAKKLFPKGWKAPKPYLRITEQPK